MCGIYGIFKLNHNAPHRPSLDCMRDVLTHRGPDASGQFISEIGAIGNTRLSILDLDLRSNQPQVSKNKKTIVVANCEIYNYLEIRDELMRNGVSFETNGDVEVVLKSFEYWGPDFVEKLNGMFAIAILRLEEKTLYLFRDRLGVKPLFYSRSLASGQFFFASEIKAINAAMDQKKISDTAVAEFFANNWVPPHKTIFENIFQLPPGCSMKVTFNEEPSIRKYWNACDIAPEHDMTESEAMAGIIKILDDATSIRQRADVEIGAFLSGGVDSSTIVGLMSLNRITKIPTFSVGFEDSRFDEGKYAELASYRFDTEHCSEKFTIKKLINSWNDVTHYCEQPHGDVSFLPTFLVSKIAARKLKVVLTGDGGDELFGGYDKYINFMRNEKSFYNPEAWASRYAEYIGLISDELATELFTPAFMEIYKASNPFECVINPIINSDKQDPVNRMLISDVATLLPANNLVKPDRMGMANSLEVRSPFLDYRLCEFAFKIPGHLKLARNETKSILKKAVEPIIGEKLTKRPKQMFTVPIGEWMKNVFFT
jgi:asparagine synthase (glutamine-hydrolysing)